MLKSALALGTIAVAVLAGCVRQPAEPPPLPSEPPKTIVQRLEGEFLIAERELPASIHIGETITVIIRATTKQNLDYIFWREILGGYAIEEVWSDEDLEFMVLYVPSGKTITWAYHLRAIRAGEDRLDGVIKAVRGPQSEDMRLRTTITVR